jgi:hypothetical protein
LGPNFSNSPAFDTKNVIASPRRHATRCRYGTQLAPLRAGRGVTFDDDVIRSDELVKRIDEIGERRQKISLMAAMPVASRLLVPALTVPSSIALTCQGLSRPQHQEQIFSPD